jgi:hypothetical protein
VAHLHLSAAAIALSTALIACHPEPPADQRVAQPTPAPVSASPVEPSSPFALAPGERPVTRVLSKRFQLSIPLPGRSGWKLQPTGRSSFVTLDHAATASRLLLSVWREPDNMTAARCEEQARLRRELPARAGLIEQRDAEIPRGFASRVDVGLVEAVQGDTLRAYVIAFGASARRCFAFVYTTEATANAEGERAIGDRLALIRGVTLGELELRTDLPY